MPEPVRFNVYLNDNPTWPLDALKDWMSDFPDGGTEGEINGWRQEGQEIYAALCAYPNSERI